MAERLDGGGGRGRGPTDARAGDPDGTRAREHGGLRPDELAGLGLSGDAVIDFSVNVNPYGPASEMRAAIARARVDLYPDPRSTEARRALAAAVGAEEAGVVLGNGAAELLWTLARVLLPPGAATIVVGPTFSEWGAAARACGAEVVEVRALEANLFEPPLDGAASLARRTGARALYLCNPNNPTGVGLRAAEIAAFASTLPDLTIVLDEAFLSLSDLASDEATALPANVVRVRSLTKEHALPGLRVGYLLAPAPLAARIEAARPAWTVSAFAQAAALASVFLQPFVAESRERLLADRRALAAALAELGLVALPTTTTYLLVPLPAWLEGGVADHVRARLLAECAVLVRSCASFGLPGHLRLGARPADERAALVRALQSLRSKAG